MDEDTVYTLAYPAPSYPEYSVIHFIDYVI